MAVTLRVVGTEGGGLGGFGGFDGRAVVSERTRERRGMRDGRCIMVGGNCDSWVGRSRARLNECRGKSSVTPRHEGSVDI